MILKRLIVGLLILITTITVLACANTASPSTDTSKAKTSVATPAVSTKPIATTTSISTPTQVTPQKGGILKIAHVGTPTQLGPPSALIAGSDLFMYPCYEALVGWTKDGTIVPTKLATSWEYSSDKKSLTFNLRRGVKFHDGTDFNASAVKFNLELSMKTRAQLATVSSVDIIDDYTVRLNLSSYSSALLYDLGQYSGMIGSPTAIQAHDKDWNTIHAVGTGPFEYVSWERAVSLKFKKFDNYWEKDKPYLDGVEYIFMADANTASSALQAGEVQIYDVALALYAAQLKAKGYQYNYTDHLIFNLMGDSANANSPFSIQKVRQALDYAIDKEAIANAIGPGLWQSLNQPIARAQVGYNPNFKGRMYGPPKAIQLLAEAGFSKGFDTTFYAETQWDRNSIIAIQTQLKEVGINAKLELLDQAKLPILQQKGWENGLLYFGMLINPNFLQTMTRYFTRSTPQLYPSQLRSDQFINLFNQALAAEGKEAQQAKIEALVTYMVEEGTITPLWTDSAISIFGNSVHTDNGVIHTSFWNPGNSWLRR